MLDAIAAETRKLAGHRKAVWTILAALPVMLAGAFCVYLVWEFVRTDAEIPKPQTAAAWAQETLGVWRLAQGPFGWFLAAGLAAVAVGGEYGWNTLKLVVPHRARTQLLLAKYPVVMAGFAVSFAVFGVVAVLTQVVDSAVNGPPVPDGVDVGALIASQGRMWVFALLTTVLVTAYGALASVVTRSTAAGAIVTIVLMTAQALFGFRLLLLNPQIYRFSPPYLLDNLGAWLRSGEALSVPVPGGAAIADPWALSLAALAAWIAGLVALAVVVFRRQDFN